jgi:hypothetical protein
VKRFRAKLYEAPGLAVKFSRATSRTVWTPNGRIGCATWRNPIASELTPSVTRRKILIVTPAI